jgi:two-component system OmpR family sensor kinase
VKNHEKQSLIKFTLIYFFSIAVFIIIFGFLYFWQQKHLIMKKTVMEMFQYSQLVVKTDFKYERHGFSYILKQDQNVAFEIPKKEDEFYIKAFPISKKEGYIVVKTLAKPIDGEILILKLFTIGLQVAFLLIFLIISYFLARKSLEPMKETIEHLDMFILDLIHDLNTPSTSILLNTNILIDKENDEKKNKRLQRIAKSAQNISSLYTNLELILTKKLPKESIDLYSLVEKRVEDFQLLYPEIKFNINIQEKTKTFSNEKALNRIIDNIISNSCKYSNEVNPIVTIEYQNKSLIIKDNGKGVKYPKKIFERSYKESELGHGIGMHIVHRLCDNLDITISLQSIEEKGTTVKLHF